MAGDWIKIENVTPDKPEVFAIAERMGIDPDAVTGKLVRIWIWADQQTITGDAASVTRASLDRLACVTGFANSMIDVGWLEETGNGLRFVHFDRHNGETAKQRALAAKRNAALRSRRNERDAAGVTSASPREEKRREEKSNTNTQDTSANADGGEATTTAITSTKPKSLIPDDDGDDEPTKAIKKAKPESINPGDLVVAWNRCVGLAPITSMTAKRKTALRARSRDQIFRDNWQAAIQRVGTTVFCCGGGPRGWRADVDWFLRPDTIVQIMEGKYDDRDTTSGNNGGSVSNYRGISSEEARLQRSLQACEDFARNG